MRAAFWVVASAMCSLGFGQDASCDRCHAAQAKSQPLTAMAHAASRAVDSEILKQHPSLTYSTGGYRYSIVRDAGAVKYTVTGGGKTVVADVLWAFGAASMGQTFLYEYRGALYESQVSFYSALNGLALTIGHRNPAEVNAELAAGRKIDKLEQTRCFRCHMTANSPGVGCERCHSGAQQHARSSGSGASQTAPAKLSKLSNEEQSDFCGECHRTWQDVQANGPHDINNIRFQPYRLATSKCFNGSPTDRRISCVGCHDPHQNVATSAAAYDAKCRACHGSSETPAARSCKVGQKDCVTCHMPKTDFPGGHFQFTDHRIRIVRGSGYPG